MKTNPKNAIFVVALLTACTLLTSMKPANDGGYHWLKARLDATKAYTIEVMKAMPEDEYDFRPSDEQRTFAAQAYHMAYSVEYFHKAFSNNGNAAWSPGDEDSKSKEELVKWTGDMFDRMSEYILTQESNDQLTAGILYFLDHNSHHRGQVVTYLRMKGITPPTYR